MLRQTIFIESINNLGETQQMPRRTIPGPTPLQLGVVSRLKSIMSGFPEQRLHENYGGDKLIGVLSFGNEPRQRLKTIVTVGLADRPLPTTGISSTRRFELVTITSVRSKNLDLVLSSCAFFMTDGDVAAEPNTIWEEECGKIEGTRWPHIFISDAERVDPKFRPFDASGETISWLFASMISDSEADFARAAGGAALEARLSALGHNRFHLNRTPVA